MKPLELFWAINEKKPNEIPQPVDKKFNFRNNNAFALWSFFNLARNTNVVVMDEAHMSVAKSNKQVLNILVNKDTNLVGLTATPGRAQILDDENKKFSDLNKFIEDRKLFSDDVVSLYDFISKFKYKSL